MLEEEMRPEADDGRDGEGDGLDQEREEERKEPVQNMQFAIDT